MKLEGFQKSVKAAFMRWIVPPKEKLFYVVAVYCILHSTSVFDNASAQTAPITSSGLNTQIGGPISVDGNVQYNITGGTRAGANLFHSFGEFGVPNHTIANFHNDSGLATSNILGRVTGGKPSNIFGTIQTSGFDNANLFLMNPAGFLFGPNATLDVRGMATFTSADYLKLEDGARFNAIPNTAADALLSASPVAAFGFLGGNSASIAIQGGTLEVADGKTLSFVGGPRVFTTETGVTVPSGVSMSGGSLSAPNGLIYMATVTSPGEIPVPALSGFPLGRLDPPSSTTATIRIRSGEFVLDHSSLTVTNTSQGEQSAIEVTVQGAMELKNVSSINTSNTSATPGSTGRGGDIVIQARQAYLYGGSTIKSDTAGQSDAGAISIQATDRISLADSSLVSNATTTDPESTAKGGPIRVHAPSIDAKGSQILSTTDGRGDAGNILIETQSLMVSGAGDFNDSSKISARTEGPGQAGAIMIRGTAGPGSHAQDIRLSGNSQIVSETLSSVLAVGGKAGSVTVNTAHLTLGKSSGIATTASGTAPNGLSPGNAGNIIVTATDSVTVSGGLITTSTGTSGRGGTITISTGTLNLTDGGQLTSRSSLSAPAGAVTIQGVQGQGSMANSMVISGKGEFGNTSGIFTNTEGTGSGGAIDLSARSLTIQNGGTISAETSGTTSRATGGSIKVKATDHVTMTNGASITASSIVDSETPNSGIADAGKIFINAGRQLNVEGSSVTTRAEKASGGNIDIKAIDSIRFTNSTISTSVGADRGNGGNITIDPNVVVLQKSQVLAQAVEGHGGNITITTQLFMPDSFSLNHIDASAASGLNGTVRIQAPYAPAGGKIQPLGNRPLQATSLLNQSCAAVAGGQFSSFTVAGRNSLPTEPSGWLSSPLALPILESHGSTATNMGLRASRNELMRGRPILSLRQIAPSGFLIHAFARDWSAGCAS